MRLDEFIRLLQSIEAVVGGTPEVCMADTLPVTLPVYKAGVVYITDKED